MAEGPLFLPATGAFGVSGLGVPADNPEILTVYEPLAIQTHDRDEARARARREEDKLGELIAAAVSAESL